jgi:hypothetical protein
LKKNKITNKKTAKKRRGPLAWLGKIADSIARLINRGPIGFFFADLYTKCNEKWKNGFVYNLFRRRKQKMRERATLAHIYEDSLLSTKISAFSTEVVHSNLRVWGVALLFFAFSVIAIAMVKYYFFGETVFRSFIIGALIAVLSFPLIISKKELGEALLKGRLTKYVITRVLNLNTTRFEKSEIQFEGSYIVAI